MDITVDDRPVMHWVEVPDTRGGTRLEARWSTPADVTSQPVLAAQAA